MHNLVILSQPAVPNIAFGWFNLAWPDVGFWIAVIVVFFLFSWARIPLVVEADAASRRKGAEQ